MSEHNITVAGGTSVRLTTAGKYCDRDIVVTSTGGTEDLDAVLTEQEALIDELKAALADKASGGDDAARNIAERTITTYSDRKLTTVGTRAFSHCSVLESVNLPEVTSIGQHGFNSCYKLKRVEFPKLTTLTPGDNFTYCYALEYADLGLVTNLPSWCLANCNVLETVVLRKSDGICTLQTTNALSSPKFTNGSAFVYVPDHLVEQYKAATNWSTYASQIKPISELEVTA